MNAILGRKKQTNKQTNKTKTKANKQTETKTKSMTFIPSIIKNKIDLCFAVAFLFLFHIIFSYLRLAKVYLDHLYNDY